MALGLDLKGLFSKEHLKGTAIAAGGGAVGGVLFDLVADLDMTDSGGVKTPVFDKAWKRAALAAGLAIVGGRVTWNAFGGSHSFAHGLMGAMGAELGRSAVAWFRGAVEGAANAPAAGLQNVTVFQPRRFNGSQLAGTSVQTPQRINGSQLAAMGV